MSQWVVDASIILNWLLPDGANEAAVAFQENLLNAECVWVPAHWRLEIANSLWVAERRKRLNAADLAQAVALFTQLPVTIDPETNARVPESLSLARQNALSVYDSAYLDLALRRGAALGSLDEALRSVARKLGVVVEPR